MSEDTQVHFPALVEAVMDLQTDAWRRGVRWPVEALLEREAGLRANRDAVLDLIYHEWVLRSGVGESASAAEYRARFPELVDEIDPMHEVYRALHPAAEAGRAPDGPEVPGPRRFHVLRPHARGGLGEVFVAQDLDLRREVALKRLRPEFGGDATSLRRFLSEVEITGRLEHPGIVPVYGLEHDGDGLPCYAMRLIRGDTLQEAIARFHADGATARDPGARILALRALLGRFVAACQAVAFAHSQGILHRDLKPANVMLGPYGETLVVDWGLAKSDRKQGRDEGTVDSEPGLFAAGDQTLPGPLGTPAFMSPEQAAGLPETLGPESDVYSLGATLYVLLTGRPPFVDGPAATVLDRVQRGDFPPPRSVNRAIDPPLEAVCLKAMSRAPSDRYATPLALAAEVERWQAGEPVEAFHEGWGRRLRRWGRRHRTWARAAGVAMIVITLSSVAAALAINTARRNESSARTRADRALVAERDARGRATANLQQAESHYQMARAAVDQFYTRISQEKLLKQPQTERLRLELLEQAQGFYQKLVDDRRTDPRARLDLASALYRLSQVEHSLGAKERAIAHAEEARSLYEALAATSPAGDLAPRVGAADTSRWTAYMLNRAGRAGPARERIDRSIRQYDAIVAAEPSRIDYRYALAENLQVLGGIVAYRVIQESAHERARTQFEAVLAAVPGHVDARLNLATCLCRLSDLAGYGGRPAQARQRIDEAVREIERVVAAGSSGDDREQRAGRLLQHGAALCQAGRFREAGDVLERAIPECEAVLASQPGDLDLQENLARCRGLLSQVHGEAGRLKEAREAARDALRGWETVVAADPDDFNRTTALITAWIDLGAIERREGRFREAVEASGAAERIVEELFARFPQAYGGMHNLRVVAQSLQEVVKLSGGSPEADQVLDRVPKALQSRLDALEKQLAAHPADPEAALSLGASLMIASAIHRDAGRTAARKPILLRASEAFGVARMHAPADFFAGINFADAVRSYGDYCMTNGDLEAGAAALMRGSREYLRLKRADPEGEFVREAMSKNLGSVANFLFSSGRAPQWADLFASLVHDFEGATGPQPAAPIDRARLAAAHFLLGGVLVAAGRLSDGRVLYLQSEREHQALCGEHSGVDDYEFALAEVRRMLGNMAREAGDFATAFTYYDQARPAIVAHWRHMTGDVHAQTVCVAVHQFLGEVLCRLGRHRDATPVYDVAAEYGSGWRRDDVRIRRAICLAHQGEHSRALTEADEMVRTLAAPVGRQLYLLACAFAQTAGAIRADATLSPDDRAGRSDPIEARAIAYLDKARAAGWFREAKNRATLDRDTDLDPLRARADFQTWCHTIVPRDAPPP
jgi:tetratricopeptide (TPR) repeat protein